MLRWAVLVVVEVVLNRMHIKFMLHRSSHVTFWSQVTLCYIIIVALPYLAPYLARNLPSSYLSLLCILPNTLPGFLHSTSVVSYLILMKLLIPYRYLTLHLQRLHWPWQRPWPDLVRWSWLWSEVEHSLISGTKKDWHHSMLRPKPETKMLSGWVSQVKQRCIKGAIEILSVYKYV